MDQTRNLLQGKRVSVVASPDRVVPLTNFVCELGMEPIMVGITKGDQSPRKDRVLKLLETVMKEKKISPGVFPWIGLDHVEMNLAEDNPDLFLGGSSWNQVYLCEKFHTPLIPVTYPVVPFLPQTGPPFMGFKGAPALAEWILSSLKGEMDILEERIRSQETRI